MQSLITHLPATLAIGVPYGSTWIIIAAVALLLFGGKKLPELGKGLGGAIKSFKQGLKTGDEEEVVQVDQPTLTAQQKTQTQLPAAGAATPQFKFDPHTGQPVAAVPVTAKFDPFTGKPISPTGTTVVTTQPMEESHV